MKMGSREGNKELHKKGSVGSQNREGRSAFKILTDKPRGKRPL